MAAYFISTYLAQENTQAAFLELIKFVTGAVFGSMFGKHANGTGQNEHDYSGSQGNVADSHNEGTSREHHISA